MTPLLHWLHQQPLFSSHSYTKVAKPESHISHSQAEALRQVSAVLVVVFKSRNKSRDCRDCMSHAKMSWSRDQLWYFGILWYFPFLSVAAPSLSWPRLSNSHLNQTKRALGTFLVCNQIPPCSFTSQPCFGGGLSTVLPEPESAALGRVGGCFTAEGSPFPPAPAKLPYVPAWSLQDHAVELGRFPFLVGIPPKSGRPGETHRRSVLSVVI